MLENPIKNPIPRAVPKTVEEAYQLMANCSAELATQVGEGNLQAAQTYARMREVYSTIALNAGRAKFDALGVDARHVAWIYRGMRAMQKTAVPELDAICAWLQNVPVLPTHKTAGSVYVAHFVQFLASQKLAEIPAIHHSKDGLYTKKNGIIHLITPQEVQQLGEEEVFWTQFREQTIQVIGGLAATMHGAQRKLPDKIAVGIDFAARDGDHTVYTVNERKEDGSIETHTIEEVSRSAARRIAWHLREMSAPDLAADEAFLSKMAEIFERTVRRPSETTEEDFYEEGQGGFLLKSDRLLVTDPRYGVHTNLWTLIENAVPGTWGARMLFCAGKPAAFIAELLGAPHARGEWEALARLLIHEGDIAAIVDSVLYADFSIEEMSETHAGLQREFAARPSRAMEGGFAVRSGAGSFTVSVRKAGEKAVGVRIDLIERKKPTADEVAQPEEVGQDQSLKEEDTMSTQTHQKTSDTPNPPPSPDPRTLEPRPASPAREGVQTADGTKTGNETLDTNMEKARAAQKPRTLDEASVPQKG